MTALWIVLGYGAWCLLACLVLPMIDDDERRLFEWARSGPPFAYTLILTFWPLVVWMMWKNGWHGPEMSDAEKAQWEAQWGLGEQGRNDEASLQSSTDPVGCAPADTKTR